MFEKQTLGVISVVLGFVAYAPYFISIFRQKTRPHIFSWVVWGAVDGIAAAAQFAGGAGAGAWAGTATSLLGFIIVFLSLRMGGDKHIVRGDWLAFACALLGIVLWRLTDNPLWAVLLATFVNLMGAVPTLRKSWHRPHEETATTYVLCCLRSAVALCALENYSFVTLFYPLAIMAENAAIAGFVLYRRAVLKRVTG